MPSYVRVGLLVFLCCAAGIVVGYCTLMVGEQWTVRQADQAAGHPPNVVSSAISQREAYELVTYFITSGVISSPHTIYITDLSIHDGLDPRTFTAIGEFSYLGPVAWPHDDFLQHKRTIESFVMHLRHKGGDISDVSSWFGTLLVTFGGRKYLAMGDLPRNYDPNRSRLDDTVMSDADLERINNAVDVVKQFSKSHGIHAEETTFRGVENPLGDGVLVYTQDGGLFLVLDGTLASLDPHTSRKYPSATKFSALPRPVQDRTGLLCLISID